MSSRRYLLFLLLLVLGFSQVPLAEEIEKKEEKTFPISKDGTVTLMGDEGNIQVSTWQRDEVVLGMTKRATARNAKEAERLLDAIEVQIQHTGNRLVIREVKPWRENNFNFFDLFDGEFWKDREWMNAWVDFDLKVPSGVRLKIESDEGDVNIEDLDGPLSVVADEGDVTLASIRSSDVKIVVDEGDLHIGKADNAEKGTWNIHMDEGSVTIEDCEVRDLDCRSDEGNIKILRLAAKRVWLFTDEGDIQVEVDAGRGDVYQMEADEGHVGIIVSEGSDLSVRLETSEGRIDTDFPISVHESDDGEIAEGEIGEDGAVLKVYADEGDIILSRSRK